MTGFTAIQLVDVGTHFGLAVVWAAVAENAWRFRWSRHPESRFFRLLPLVATGTVFSYSLFALSALLPPEVRSRPTTTMHLLGAVHDIAIFIVVSLARHMARYFPRPEPPPATPLWLVINYGSAILVCLSALAFLDLIRVPHLQPWFAVYPTIRIGYQLVMLGSIVWMLMPIARPGMWGTGAAWGARRGDVIFLSAALLSLVAWLYVASTSPWRPLGTLSVFGVVMDAVAGIGFSLPLALRIFGEVVRTLFIAAGLLGGTATILFVVRPLALATFGGELQPVIDFSTVVILSVLLVRGHAWLRQLVDQVVFRRSHQRRLELQEFLRTLSPELGVMEVCIRTLAEVVKALQLRSAALFLDDGRHLVHGTMKLERLLAAWPRARADGIPSHALFGYELRELPMELVDALGDADIVGVVPIMSPRRRWGTCFLRTSLLGAAFSEDEVQGAQAFADQVALVLDGADLLARTVAVERSLAHAEKLAAIGELGARVAHEIRNPVTAARSLAQQLVRDPTSPLNTEHASLILTELERVERQVAALLRFARRDEFRLELVDLGELVRGTVEGLRSRFEGSGVDLQLELAEQVTARVDREKLRQVLINVFENALDALGDGRDAKRVAIVVAGQNGSAIVRVTDNGPGVSGDALPHLFEPFFSLKSTGTGLGLAIARRTVEAQGGKITATTAAEGGLMLELELPFANPADRSSL